MNPEAKALWLTALRSGKYQQGKGYLTKGDAHCCLGVLCQVAMAAGVEIETSVAFVHRDGFSVTSYDDADLLPPDSVLEWAGLTLDNPTVRYSGHSSALATLNDGEEDYIEPLTFNQIADIIEEQL